jgi:uncharacterized damage-inducible protein DinB
MTTSLYHDAMAHHIWASERLIDACAVLSPEQLRAVVPGTYGPIIANLHHLVISDGGYLGVFRDWTNVVEEDVEITLAELRAAITADGAAWMALLDADLDGEQDMPERGDGWIFHAPLGFRLAQVIHHGTDHRSQVCTGLTSLGIEPPEIDLWGYGKATGRTRGEDLRPA